MPILLCDLDETLLDRAETFHRWATGFADDHGLPPHEVEAIVAEDRGGYRTRQEFFDAMNVRYSLPEPLSVEAYRAAFTPLFRTTDSVVRALHRARSAGWQVAVVSNGSAAQIDKVTTAELDRLVDVVCISEVEGCSKPDRRLLDIAAARLGSTLERAWMIGDNAEADIGAAVGAGIDSVWLRLGRTWPRDDCAPTAEADTFEEAVDIVLSPTT